MSGGSGSLRGAAANEALLLGGGSVTMATVQGAGPEGGVGDTEMLSELQSSAATALGSVLQQTAFTNEGVHAI